MGAAARGERSRAEAAVRCADAAWQGARPALPARSPLPAPLSTPSFPPACVWSSCQELFGRILSQINRSKRDILHDKYTQCKAPTTSVMARSVFIRVLKRIAESFISCLLNMQQNPSLQA